MKPKFSHQPRKRFGQNFLQDVLIVQKIIEAIHPTASDNMIEIGPGLGALTQPLLDKVDRLEVVELDRNLAEQLQIRFGQSNKLNIHAVDALRFDFNTLYNPSKENNAKLRIVGNLPYNISTPLMFHLFKFCNIIQDMHFMFQKEVVDRLTALPNTKQYGRLSIMVQYYCQTHYLFSVGSHAFYPAPKVQSAVVRLIPHTTPLLQAIKPEVLQYVTRTAFNQRRKTLSNALKTYLTAEDFIKLGIDPMLRPEALSLTDYVQISNYLVEQNKTSFLDLEEPGNKGE
jgi:16S rRNA (adenine1518-N6/adenine1519-N6)-dimethyltransferase